MPLEIIRNDITRMVCDAIVNPTDSFMSGSGGADYAIHAAAGPALTEECRLLGTIEEGQAKITPAFNLPCRYVIHTVGPKKDESGYVSYGALESCYRNSLVLAAENGCQSIAFPLIATGTFGFPKDKGIDIAVKEIERFLAGSDMLVYLVVHDEEGYSISKTLRDDIADYISGNIIPGPAERPQMNETPSNPAFFNYIPASGAYQSQRIPAKHCRNCGAVIEEEDLYCGNCGSRTSGPPVLFDFEKNAAPEPEKSEKKREKRSKKKSEKAGSAFDLSLLDASEEAPSPCASSHPASFQMPCNTFNEAVYESDSEEALTDILKEIDESFSQMLLRKIDEKNMTDAQCYKKANIDRRLFSRIRGDVNYKPSKSTVLAFAIALELPPEETNEMLRKAGFALSHSNKADIIVEYFINKGIYNIFTINEALFEFDQPLLGGVKS